VAAGSTTSFTGVGTGAESLNGCPGGGPAGTLCWWLVLPPRSSVSGGGGWVSALAPAGHRSRCAVASGGGSVCTAYSLWCFAIVSGQVACPGCSKPCGAFVPAGGTGITGLACFCRGCMRSCSQAVGVWPGFLCFAWAALALSRALVVCAWLPSVSEGIPATCAYVLGALPAGGGAP
jgi:hypothetical protein